MGEFITALNHLNVSPLNTFLLVALSIALRAIAKGIVERIERGEARIVELEACKHRHETSLAVIKTRLEIVEDHEP